MQARAHTHGNFQMTKTNERGGYKGHGPAVSHRACLMQKLEPWMQQISHCAPAGLEVVSHLHMFNFHRIAVFKVLHSVSRVGSWLVFCGEDCGISALPHFIL